MNQEEENLRNNIRQLIRHVKQKRLDEEQQIRDSLKTLMRLELHNMLFEAETPDQDPAPNKSTGINVLEDLLKKIVPILKDDFRLLTTNEDQRNSFRAHIVKAVVDTLTPVDVNNEAEVDSEDEPEEFEEEEIEVLGLNEIVDIEITSDELDDDKFIDIRTDKEIAEEDGEEEEEDPRDEFGKGLEDLDTTGRNMAYNTFKKIQTNIIDSYELLDDPEDQELFYDYLIANIKLYFDKFEDELDTNVEEPTNQAYEDAKAEQEPEEELGGELEGLLEINLD
tara:strand:+ start:402 stop:1241 length:840 start_codon:yes stop_codon:yes gene_type:complete